MSDRIPALFELFKQATGVTIDNRTIAGGEIFFALKGERTDGNLFAAAAIEKGALCAVVDDPQYVSGEKCFLVEDSLTALQQLAALYRNTFSFPVLALTGSNGKTTTKELIRAVLAKKFTVHATKGNLNNHIGVPLTLLSVKPDCTFAIIEMGANHRHEIEGYCKIADPDFGLITNIGKAHLEGFGGEEGVLKGKSELFIHVMRKGGTVFYCSNQTKLNDIVAGYDHVFTYGYQEADYVAGKLMTDTVFATVEMDDEIVLHSHLVGSYNADNMLAAACIGKYFGLGYDAIADAVESYIPDNNRSELKEIGGNYFILDAYNANPSSMKAAIMHLRTMEAKNKIAILGDMLELGEYAEGEHKQIVELALASGLNRIVTVGPEFGKIPNAHILHFNSSDDAAIWWKQQSLQGATILLKGSRGIKLENIIK